MLTFFTMIFMLWLAGFAIIYETGMIIIVYFIGKLADDELEDHHVWLVIPMWVILICMSIVTPTLYFAIMVPLFMVAFWKYSAAFIITMLICSALYHTIFKSIGLV